MRKLGAFMLLVFLAGCGDRRPLVDVNAMAVDAADEMTKEARKPAADLLQKLDDNAAAIKKGE
jgi:predicted small lipoprotein YifL